MSQNLAAQFDDEPTAVAYDSLVTDDWMSSEERQLFLKAQCLIPTLASREASCEAHREMPADTMEDFKRTGILRVLQPRKFGGFQGTPLLSTRIVEELALGCSSSAWVYAVFAEHSWIIACFPEQAQIEVWGDHPEAVASSSLAPRATARRIKGGYQLSGRYPFSSGCTHAQWVIVAAFCHDERDTRHQRYMLVPLPDVHIFDDWRVLGLRGTGSRTLLLDDVFIPEHRTVRLDALATGDVPGRLLHPDYPLLRSPRTFLAAFSQPPVTLSIGRRALNYVSTGIRSRISRGVTKIAESQVVQMKIAEAAAQIDMAGLVFRTRCQKNVVTVNEGRPIGSQDILATRRDVVFAQASVRSAVEKLSDISNTDLVYDTSPLQSFLRDALTTSTHFSASWEAGMVPYGRAQLGLPPVTSER